MSLHYGIKQPLRFVKNPAHRNKFRKGGGAKNFQLLCPTVKLLPFQIKRDSGYYPLTSIKLMDDSSGAYVLELLPHIDSSDMDVFVFSTYDYLVHYGSLEHSAGITAGDYYLEVTDSVEVWYSETVTFKTFDPETLGGCALTRVTYWDTCDVDDIFYRTFEANGKQYKNIFYLDIGIGKPAYPITEEGDEDAFGSVVLESVKLEKQYNLQGVFPEFFLDALALLPMHLVRETGKIQVLTSEGYESEVLKVTVNPNWQEPDGVIAITDLTFVTDVAIATNCCDNLEDPLVTCLKEAFDVVSLQVQGTDNYDNFEYMDAVTALQVPLVHGDRVLVKWLSGAIYYMYYNSGIAGYSPTGSFANGAGAIDLNRLSAGTGDIYYYFKTGIQRFYKTPVITDISDPVTPSPLNTKTIKGNAWKHCIIEIWENVGGELVKQGVGLGTDFIGAGIDYLHDPDAGITYIKCVGLNCVLGQSPNKYWVEGEPTDEAGGIGIMEIGTTFIVGGGIVPEEDEEDF